MLSLGSNNCSIIDPSQLRPIIAFLLAGVLRKMKGDRMNMKKNQSLQNKKTRKIKMKEKKSEEVKKEESVKKKKERFSYEYKITYVI